MHDHLLYGSAALTEEADNLVQELEEWVASKFAAGSKPVPLTAALARVCELSKQESPPFFDKSLRSPWEGKDLLTTTEAASALSTKPATLSQFSYRLRGAWERGGRRQLLWRSDVIRQAAAFRAGGQIAVYTAVEKALSVSKAVAGDCS